jgi:3-oxoadipate enol-lactonase
MIPIIFIHGFPLDASMWQQQVEYFRGRGHSVLAPDLPGFGGEPPLPREHCSIDAFADKIHELIVREARGQAIVGGFSMGGYVLLALLRNHPEAVAAAVFIDTRAEADSPDGRSARLKSVEEIPHKGPGALIDTMMGKVLAKKPNPAVKEQTRAMMERQSPEGILCAQLAMSKRRDQTDLLARLTLPVLIIVGSEDAVTPPSVALAMQSHVPHAMVAQIVSAGHMSPMEQPAAVNSTIETFLSTVHTPA